LVLGETMSKVSVIIPARKEAYIRETVNGVLSNAAGDVEVILVIDGPMPDYELPKDKRLRIYHNPQVHGLRACLVAAIDVAKGKYLMKLDAHCSLGEGWDKILQADCEDNWIVVPSRYLLDVSTWEIQTGLPIVRTRRVDAMAYVYPYRSHHPTDHWITGRPWLERKEEYKDEMLLEDMCFQGSMWFMHKEHFYRIGGMPTSDGYGTFDSECQELALKTQLGPWEGKVMRNKNTWYAHWSKPPIHWREPEKYGRITDEEKKQCMRWVFYHWWNNKWVGHKHTFQWLVDKFSPLPGFPDNWRELEAQYGHERTAEPPRKGYKEVDKDTQFQLEEQ